MNIESEIDPTTLKTDAGRQLLKDLKKTISKIDSQIRRTFFVIEEYLLLKRNLQEDLIDAACYWSYATLASHNDSNICEKNFDAFIDVIYISLDENEEIFKESEKVAIHNSIAEKQISMNTQLTHIYEQSINVISQFGKDSLNHTTAQLLYHIHAKLLQLLPNRILYNILLKSFMMNKAIPNLTEARQLERIPLIADLQAACLDALKFIEGNR